MADGDSGDGGNTSIGGDSNSTGYGGDSFANSEYGVYSSPDIQSFSNTGAEGSQPLPNSWTQRDEQQRNDNLILQKENRDWISSQATQAGNSRGSAMMAGMNPGNSRGSAISMLPSSAYSPGASNPNSDFVEPTEDQKPDEPMKSPGPSGPVSKSKAPDWMTGKGSPNYTVQRNPYPFTPVQPVAGSGVKESFFKAQNDLLKTMLPYWNK